MNTEIDDEGKESAALSGTRKRKQSHRDGTAAAKDVVPAIKKRSREAHKAIETELNSADFGPPRQSERIRINYEYPEDPVRSSTGAIKSGEDGATTKKKRAGRKIAGTSKGDGRLIPIKAESTSPEKGLRQGKKSKKEKKVSKERHRDTRPAEAAERILDTTEVPGENVAVQSGSHFCLELMAHFEPFVAGPSSDGVRVNRKTKKTRTASDSNGKTTKKERQPDSRFVEIDRTAPKRAGIRSSTFVRVMRLVADLPGLYPPQMKAKRLPAAHRPPVWAEVSHSVECREEV